MKAHENGREHVDNLYDRERGVCARRFPNVTTVVMLGISMGTLGAVGAERTPSLRG